MKKVTMIITFALITLVSFGQSKKVTVIDAEIDSIKSRLAFISQTIGNLKCITQGEAQALQTELYAIMQTIVRKEEKPEIKKQ